MHFQAAGRASQSQKLHHPHQLPHVQALLWICNQDQFTLIGFAAIITSGIIAFTTVRNHHVQPDSDIDEVTEFSYTRLNDRMQLGAHQLANVLKNSHHQQKKSSSEKHQDHVNPAADAPRVFAFECAPDAEVSKLHELRAFVDLMRYIARPNTDRVVLLVTSPGGLVQEYGLAASQIERLRDGGLHVTACVDRVAASGGMMMVAVASEICAAPWAVIGSIGQLI